MIFRLVWLLHKANVKYHDEMNRAKLHCKLQSENTNLRGRITVLLTSYLFIFDSAALFKFNQQQLYLLGQIQTSQTGGQQHSDTSPYGECSLVVVQACSLLQLWEHQKLFDNSLILLPLYLCCAKCAMTRYKTKVQFNRDIIDAIF